MNPHPLTDAQYRSITDSILASVERSVDRWLQDDVIDIDSSRTGGLLELTLPNRGKLIINTQPPLQELWLAARAGGFHFKWLDGAWRDTRDGEEFFSRLSACATQDTGQTLTFVAPNFEVS